MKKDLALKINLDRADIYSLCLGLFALLFFLTSFFYGLNRGFQNWITEGIEYQNVNLATAVTKFAHGLDLGGIAHGQVYDTLREGGIAFYPRFLEPLGVKFPNNLNDPVLINKAFRAAAELEELSPDRVVYKDVKPVEPVDLGMAQYYEFAFELFGLKVQSFYYFYALILLLTLTLFYIRHYGNPFYCALLTLFAALHLFMFVYCAEFLPPKHQWGVGTVYASRFISILGIIPAAHIVIDIFKNPKFRLISFLTFALQGLILIWMVTVRGSVLWAELWVLASIAIIGLIVVVARIISHFRRSEILLSEVYRLISWPVGTFLILLTGFGAYQNSTVDPFYRFSYESLPYHMVWHSIYAGLAQHPDWDSKYGQYYVRDGQKFTGDGMPLFAAEQLLETQYGIDRSYIKSKIWGNRYRATERIIKEAYIQFIKKDPRFVAELFFIYRPVILYRAIMDNLQRVFSHMPFYVYLALGFSWLFLIIVMYQYWQSIRNDFLILLGALLLGVGGAIGPVMVTFAVRLAVNDQVFMLMLFGSLFLSVLGLLLFSIVRFKSFDAAIEILSGRRGFSDRENSYGIKRV